MCSNAILSTLEHRSSIVCAALLSFHSAMCLRGDICLVAPEVCLADDYAVTLELMMSKHQIKLTVVWNYRSVKIPGHDFFLIILDPPMITVYSEFTIPFISVCPFALE